MAYRVYILESLDKNNWTELDTEEVDFTTIFAVADIEDISVRKDSITKQVTFKGSPTNNQAFGSLFHLNKASDFSVDNRLFFNYNPLRTVDCLIYEDGSLLMRGSLRVLEINVDQYNNVMYDTVITGSFIDFRNIVSEKLLEDLDFTDLQHHYTWSNIQDTWEQRTERYNTTTSAFNYKPFQKGSGYVYPFIDYGVIYKQASANSDVNNIHINNFRPAIYAKEYFDRIFKQPELTGYTYEVRGDQDIKDRFNSLVIPSNIEKMVSKSTTLKEMASQVGSASQSSAFQSFDNNSPYPMTRAIQLPNLVNDAGIIGTYGAVQFQGNTSFIANRAFTSSGYCKVKLNTFDNRWPYAIKVSLQLCAREFKPSTDSDFGHPDTWNVVAEKPIMVNAHSGLPANTVLEFEVGERTYDANSQFMLRLHFEGAPFFTESVGVNTYYTFSEAVIRFPKDATSPLSYDVQPGDVITPTPADGIKQMDFMKSIIGLFNFYVYTNPDRPKHLIFERYDDFYALTSPPLLAGNAVDWTSKIDYTNGLKVMSNVKVPKKYLFTFKDDGDYFNKDYKTRYAETYGTFRFNDAYGIGDEKTIESVFSPSPLISVVGTGRVYPAIYQVSGANKQPVKSNIRVMYYNGVKNSPTYQVGKDTLTNNTPTVASVATSLTKYPQVGNYYLQSGPANMKPLEDLYWGLAKFMYFTFTNDHQNAPTAYHLHYKGQVTSITKPDVVLVDCESYLNEVDVANMDLRQPVFVDMGENGAAYFKLLSVEYVSNEIPARLSLQKIDV